MLETIYVLQALLLALPILLLMASPYILLGCFMAWAVTALRRFLRK